MDFMNKVYAASMLAVASADTAFHYAQNAGNYIVNKVEEYNRPPVGRMVDVGGYKLHMIDEGVGQPTVVINTGLGNTSLDWSLVYPEIAKFTHVLVCDRAGYAWSDASPLPRTSENIVKELHTMLKISGVQGPYILVGHSFGGMNVRLYATTYPDEVAGVVLVDSSHENQGTMNSSSSSPILQSIESLTLYLASQFSSLKFIEAVLGEYSNFSVSCAQIKASGGLLGDNPLTVITAAKEVNSDWFLLQKDLANRSSQGKQIFATQSGHAIFEEQPAIIVDAVREMLHGLSDKK